MELNILDFINSNEEWENILSSPPYNLIIKKDADYILIKYNQLFSDFKETFVKEARGLILRKEEEKYILVCMPFTKFFNIGDPNAKEDLETLFNINEWYLEEKIDGSFIKLFYDKGKWNIATNGTIDAEKAELQFKMKGINNYKELFLYASKDKIDYDKLDKEYTYMFELVGMENKVIVPYEKENVYYLGRRSIKTLLEVPYFEDSCSGVEKCERPICSIIKTNNNPQGALEEIEKKANNLTKNDKHFEGYVLSDKSLKTKVKIKSKEYMDLFSIKGNGIFTPRKILLMILDQKEDDLLSSFPEYQEQFDIVRKSFKEWINKIKRDLDYIKEHKWDNKKDFAEWAKLSSYPPISFRAYGTPELNYDWLEKEILKMGADKIAKIIELDNCERKE